MLLYVTVPGFYAEVERSAEPALRERPVIVGGDPRKRGTVQGATAEAREAGVEDGMPMQEALQRCPRARALRTNMRRYREASQRLRALLRRVSPRVEPAGLGAAYLDAAGLAEPPERLAAQLRESVAAELGWPLCVGIAPVKFLAKLAAEEAGGRAFLRVDAGEVAAFLRPLPVERLPGVGPKTAARLAELGARTAGDVVTLERAALEEAFGNHGLTILGYARGQDVARVRAAPHPRSLSQETSLPAEEVDLALLREQLAGLAGRLEAGLALEGLAAKRVLLKVRYADGEQVTRSRTLVHAVRGRGELAALAADLLGRTQAGTRPVRGLGLAAASLLRARRDDRQLDLFGPRR